MKHNFLKKLMALLLGTIMVFSMIPAIAIGTHAADETYKLVTSVDDLEAGAKYLIVCDSKNFALGAISTTKTKYGLNKDVTIKTISNTNKTITGISSDVEVVTLGGSEGAWTLKISSGYLTWSSGNSLDTSTSNTSVNEQWKITIDSSNGNATILNGKDNTRKLQYNATSPRFACYTSSQTAIQLYKYIESTTPEHDCADNDNDCICDVAGCGKPIAHIDIDKNCICDNCTTQLEHNYVNGACDVCGDKLVGYVLVTDASTLKVGDRIIIVNKDKTFALSTTQSTNNRAKVAIEFDGDVAVPSEDVQIITLQAGNKSGTFAFNVGNGYLYAASSDSNYLRTEEKLSDNSSWAITITSQGVATVKAQGTNTRNWLRYNSTNGIFSCYGSGQGDISIYKLPGDESACVHTYDNCESTVCNQCGEGERTPLEHEYTNEYDATCNKCTAGDRTVTLPADGSTLDLITANKIGVLYSKDAPTTEKYYVTGVITEIKNTEYGNMYIKDAAGNEFYVYGVYCWGGATRYDALAEKPQVGDTITLYGVIGSYYGAAQMQNAWISNTYKGFGLTLNKGVTVRVKFNVTAEWLEANPDAKVVFSNGEKFAPIAGENTYTTTLTPGQIGTDLTVTLGNITKTVSVSAYIEKAKAAYATDTKLCALLDAIDAYGKAAAKVEQSLTAPDFEAIDDYELEQNASIFTGFTDVTLGEYATIGLNVNAEEGYTFVASRGTATTGKLLLADHLKNGALYIENIRPANFGDVITVTIYDGETVVSTIDFTFNSYLKLAYGKATTDLDRNIVIAAYNYGVAAAAYVNK